LTYSGRFTHINGQSSATGRVQYKEGLPAKDRHSTAVPRNQMELLVTNVLTTVMLSQICCITLYSLKGDAGDGRMQPSCCPTNCVNALKFVTNTNNFTAQCKASAVYAAAVCPPVCPSQFAVLSKRLNVGSQK